MNTGRTITGLVGIALAGSAMIGINGNASAATSLQTEAKWLIGCLNMPADCNTTRFDRAVVKIKQATAKHPEIVRICRKTKNTNNKNTAAIKAWRVGYCQMKEDDSGEDWSTILHSWDGMTARTRLVF